MSVALGKRDVSEMRAISNTQQEILIVDSKSLLRVDVNKLHYSQNKQFKNIPGINADRLGRQDCLHRLDIDIRCLLQV